MEEKDVILSIIFTTVVLLLLVAFLMFFLLRYRTKSNSFILEKDAMKKAFEQMLLQSQIEVQETTFAGLSKELHDNIGQLLSSTKMLLGITQLKLGNSPDTLTVAEETLGKAISELRSLSKALDKDWLNQFDFIHNLEVESSRINQTGTLQILFSHPDKILLKPDVQIVLFRIVQEAIQNAIKHSQASQIDISLSVENQKLLINVTDNGIGFNSDRQADGLGMKNMKQRINLLGGNIRWRSNANGVTVTIDLPYNENEL